jgi:DNA polymerase
VDGRLHGSFHFFGAHTGRWAGRRTQPHNFPRLAFVDEEGEWDELAEKEAILALLLGGQVSAEELKKLVRPLFVGPFTDVDYAAIEARVIAWLAGEEWVLEAARAGRDLYVETAKQMGGLTRAQGKIAVLALGYNGGPGALRRMAAPGDEVLSLTDEELYDTYVYPWRNANSKTVQLWRRIEHRFRVGGEVGEHLFVEKDGNDRLIRLPSGRAICYRKCGIQKRKRLNPRTGEWEEREQLTFWSPQGKRTATYGGKLAENVTQAVARDLLAEALVRLETHGYPVVEHVHDEILDEGVHDVDTISKVICELPTWAAGLPVDGEGFVTERYRKG